MKKLHIIIVVFMMFSITSCVGDLDIKPIDENLNTSDKVFKTDEGYMQLLAKCYASFVVSGQKGPSGNGDITGLDEGSQASFSRMLWTHQELPTDEAVCVWNDQTIKDFHWNTWKATDPFTMGMYDRLIYNVSLCNEFIRRATNPKFAQGVAEVRFLRSLSYWYLLDLFGGNVPFTTEADLPGSFFPKQTNAKDLFVYIEKELKAVETIMANPKTAAYGRADRGAAWMVLAKLYLNAKVYIGVDKNTEAITYTKKIIDATVYSLQPNYKDLFLADNRSSKEIIYSLIFDGDKTKTHGGMRFLIFASTGGDQVPKDRGVSGGWGGLITTPDFVRKFEAPVNGKSPDNRAMFYTEKQELGLKDVHSYTNGYGITKFNNINSDGSAASSVDWPDTDFPLFRLADVYLMYAEAILRGGNGGDKTEALGYVNKLIERAFGNVDHKISDSELTLDFILEERSRELYWESHRRTDLIRFGKFTSNTYTWAWKGNVKEGKGFSSYLKIFPLPQSDLTANPNLKQNPNY